MHPNFSTITSFLTDGSLAALCAAMSRLAGARVALIDPEGRSIVLGEDDQPWHVRPPGPESPRLAAALRDGGLAPTTIDERFVLLPLVVQGSPVGAIMVDYADGLPGASTDASGERRGAPVQRDLLEFAVEMLASTVSEFCEQAMEVNLRHSELRTLFRLSSLLVATRDTQTILQVAMRSAVEVFSMDACAVHLIDDNDGPLTLRGHVGLPDPFTRGIALLPGSIHESPAERGRDVVARLAHESSFEGIVGVALLFKDQPVGVLRLFSREQRLLSPSQHALLQTIAEQAAAAVCGAKLVESEREAVHLRRQLELAGDVQHRMLPQKPPVFSTLDIAARYDPSFELSGDFYDLIELNGHLGVAVGDVSGKGIPAALLMAATRATLRAHSQDVFHLDELMGRVNDALVRDTLTQEFVTIFYGVIDPKNLRLTYCNAGHDPPLVLQKAPKSGPNAGKWTLHELSVGGMVVGVDPTTEYERGMFDLSKGDVLVASTDGLTDAMNFQSEKFGRARLKQTMLDFLSANPGASAAHIADHLLWDVRRFVGMNRQVDDITLVVIRAK
ncbi:MAG: PP2C family protein-serine/threonine phosphatase [Phycisphaerales bacterium]